MTKAGATFVEPSFSEVKTKGVTVEEMARSLAFGRDGLGAGSRRDSVRLSARRLSALDRGQRKLSPRSPNGSRRSGS